MRIADKMNFAQINHNISKNRTDMSELQNQAATQKRVTKPSDDPMAASRVLTARTEEKGNKQFIKGIEAARSFLEFSDQSLSEMTDILIRAKELAVGQSNDAGANEESRRTVGTEVEQILNQGIQIGNRKLGERYIFAGFKTQKMPFNQNGEYLGDDGDMKIPINKDAFVTMNLPGNRIFMGEGYGEDGYVKNQNYTPVTAQEIHEFKLDELQRRRDNKEIRDSFVETRGPASLGGKKSMGNKDPITQSTGVNIYGVLKSLEISLKANDKEGIQEALDFLDQGISQVVLARSELGARIMSINNLNESIQKAIVDNKTTASQLEDADAFQVISDINKTDSALKASLETSGKLIQTSLLDFLR